MGDNPEGTHYSLSQTPLALHSWSERIMPDLMRRLNGAAPIFVYRGMSGISAATAISMAYARMHGTYFGMIYVRKPEEDSHGIFLENNLLSVQNHRCMLVFVDDFVASGTTERKTLKAVLDGSKYPNSRDFTSYIDMPPRVDKRDFIRLTTRDGVDMNEIPEDWYPVRAKDLIPSRPTEIVTDDYFTMRETMLPAIPLMPMDVSFKKDRRPPTIREQLPRWER